jgi:hypothetical protein
MIYLKEQLVSKNDCFGNRKPGKASPLAEGEL